ncbi:MAG: SpoIIE family protein phosphatase [Vicinamibacterales bacterium]
MRAIRALVVDDEPPARARLRRLLDALGGVTVVAEAGNAAEARELIHDLRPDVLFLDVELPEVRGTTLAASLPEPRPFVVFATAYEQYTLDAFACDATDYLVKPVSRHRLAATLDRVRDRLERRGNAERDLAAASALQADMWPVALPAIPGFDCAAASLPARGVGGDFYDAFALTDGTWGLLLGDVSGKGMAAGLVATAVQARVQTAARHARMPPARLGEAVNADVFASTQGQRYATLIYAELDAASRRLRLVNAGHPAARVFTPGVPEGQPLPSSGPALGLMGTARFETLDAEIPPGGCVVAFSDGVEEALDLDDVEFGVDRIDAIIGREGAASAAHLCAAIIDAVRRHRGPRQDQDDVTVLVVKGV